MKKFIFISNLVLVFLVCLITVFYILEKELIFKLLYFFGVGLIIILNIILNYKNKSKPLYYIIFSVGIFILILADLTMQKVPYLGLILLILSNIAFVVAQFLNSKFNISDVVYSVSFFVPLLLTIIIAPIFGMVLSLKGFLGIILAVSMSCFLGKTVSSFVLKKNLDNSMRLVAVILTILANLMSLIFIYANTPLALDYVYKSLYYLSLLFLAFSLFFSSKNNNLVEESNNENIKFNLKCHIKSAVSLLLIVALSMVSLVFGFMQLNVVNPKVSKNYFINAIGKNIDIPIIEIKTQNGELPQNKKDYVNCSFSITNCEDESQNFAVDMADEYGDDGSVGIRLRGNSTMYAQKKPYRIKFDEKQSIFGLKKNKSWVLLADFYDQSYIRNYTAFAIADSFDNLSFSPTGHHVALFINNEFKGLYLLCEQIDENSGRADVKDDFDVSKDKEFPFLVEMDIHANLEGITGIDNFNIEGFYPVEIKYPESDERDATSDSDVVYDYIYEYLNAVFATLKTGQPVSVSFRENPVTLEDLVDIESAVDFYLVNEIMVNYDSYQKSIYFHKTKDGKLKFGPVWDFDYSMIDEFEIPYKKSYIEYANSLHLAKRSPIYSRLLANETFYNMTVQRYNEKKNVIIDVVNHLKNYKSIIKEIAIFDAKIWHGTTGEFQFGMQYDYVRLFLQDRHTYLDNVFSKTHSEFLAIVNS